MSEIRYPSLLSLMLLFASLRAYKKQENKQDENKPGRISDNWKSYQTNPENKRIQQ